PAHRPCRCARRAPLQSGAGPSRFTSAVRAQGQTVGGQEAGGRLWRNGTWRSVRPRAEPGGQMTHDLLGRPLTEAEAQLARLYADLKTMAARDDLPPCAERNVKKALACMWQVVNDLDLEFEQLYDLGV